MKMPKILSISPHSVDFFRIRIQSEWEKIKDCFHKMYVSNTVRVVEAN